MIEDSQLLLFWNGFWDTRDGQVNIETWYLEVTFDNIFLVMKQEILLESKLNLCTSQRFISNFRINKIFSYLVSFTGFRSTEFTLALALSSHTKNFHFSLSSSLNRLNAWSACHKLELIDNAQNLSSSFICRDTQYPNITDKSSFYESGCVLQDKNMLFTDPT